MQYFLLIQQALTGLDSFSDNCKSSGRNLPVANRDYQQRGTQSLHSPRGHNEILSIFWPQLQQNCQKKKKKTFCRFYLSVVIQL